ncbi:MAG: hypothetical protein JWP20_2220 [Roseomonas sp.]|jgi:uncharacterized OB-fold protein|nr:hypothetical protein [Roseomonas sp.]
MSEAVDPPINALNAPFWEGAKTGRLVLPHCVTTGRAFWPPAPISPYTTGAVTWREVAPEGWLRACVTYERVFQASFRPLVPYYIGLVEVQAGPRLQAHLAGGAMPPAIGQAVRIAFRSLIEGAHPVPVILPAAN